MQQVLAHMADRAQLHSVYAPANTHDEAILQQAQDTKSAAESPYDSTLTDQHT